MEAQLSKALLRWGLPCEGAVRDGAGWLPAPRLCPCAGNGIQDTLESCAKQDWCCHPWHIPSLQCQGELITDPESRGGQRPSGVQELWIPILAGLCPCGSSVCSHLENPSGHESLHPG